MPSQQRIASFLPSATEMICELGLYDDLVAVSHECNYPPQVKEKTVVVKSAVDYASMTLDEVDKTVSERVSQGKSLYVLDEKALQTLAPTLIVSQDLCKLCAASGNEVTQVLKSLKPKPEILWQTPHSLEDVLSDFLALGEKTGTQAKAQERVREARQRIEKVKALTEGLPKVRAFFMEWVDPIYCGGHWIPEMIGWAGGTDPIARPGVDSVRTAWEDVTAYNPDVLVVAPCGFDTKQAAQQVEQLKLRPGWKNLSAVKKNQVFAAAANAYFARPGLRLVTGVEILASLFHPEACPWNGPADAFAHIPLS
ncbi:MAG TPA: cobalamin-binding protein [bacterium]|nr:cobalamin-binding protein [bacterium]